MRSKIYSIIIATLIVYGCEQIVDVKVNDSDPYLVVDGWLTHTPGDQVIRLTLTQPYYDNTFAEGVSNATVKVTDSDGNLFDFESDGEGNYIWTSADTFGVVGRSYDLEIIWNGNTYTATSSLNRGTTVDSIRYTYEPESGFSPAYYYAQFYGTDPDGEGDCYWLKAWRNGKYLGEPSEIYPIYDASFSKGNGDGIPFIMPIRTYPNPYEQDINRNFIPPYNLADTFEIGSDGTFKLYDSKVKIENDEIVVVSEGDDLDGGVASYPLDGAPFYQLDATHIARKADSLYVELHAITPETWFFITRVQEETDRPTGFGALFATPPANVPTNIIAEESGVSVVGFFSVSRVSAMGTRISEATILPENP